MEAAVVDAGMIMNIETRDFAGRTSVLLLLLGLASGLVSASPQAQPAAAPSRSVQPVLNLKALAEPLQDLTAEERNSVDAAYRLIRQKKHLLALTSLTSLTETNPKNSAIRVLRAYVLLELGNITGSLNDASFAEESGGRSAYRCWFLAQVAYLAGDKPLCRREIGHISHNPTYGPKAEKLGRKLDGAK